MSITQIIPPDSRPIKTENSFTATFNAPTVNKYDWNVAGNTDVLMLALRPHSLYFLERVNFSLDISEQAFHQGFDTTLEAAVKYSSKGELVYGSKLPLLNYLTNFEIHQFAGGGRNRTETLVIDFRGVLKQVAAMNQVATITAFLSWSVYQIMDDNWRTAFENGKLWELISGVDPRFVKRIIEA